MRYVLRVRPLAKLGLICSKAFANTAPIDAVNIADYVIFISTMVSLPVCGFGIWTQRHPEPTGYRNYAFIQVGLSFLG